MKIPFYKPSIGPEEIDEVVSTLRSGWLTTGPKTKQFEREFGDYLHRKHAVALNSCTAALHLALEAIGLKAGQTVVVPTMTFAATAEVVRYLGARPLLVDCRTEDFNLDVADAERKIESALKAGEKIVAIMPVHYGGQIGDVAGVRALAERYNLKIIEDAAHCCPAYYKEGESEVSSQWSVVNGQSSPWLPVGADADITCFSFYANKTITTGEGGMACTDNDEYADRMRIMSLHGISRDAWKRYTAEGSWYYEIIAPGYKYNMADIAAAIGIHQLRKADAFHRRRAQLAVLYDALLSDVEEIILPAVQPGRIHSWHLYALRLRLNKLQIDRDQFITELQQRGVCTSVHWMPLHMHPYYRDTYGYRSQDLPVASALYPELITLPLYPDMTEGDLRYVCDSIKEIIAANRRFIAATESSAAGAAPSPPLEERVGERRPILPAATPFIGRL
jgi:perosamine synthetase